MVVHYAGMVCDMNRINALSEKYKIPVIEDAAHAFMSKYKGQFVGNNSPYTCFSFQAIKHLTTVDGGLIGTDLTLIVVKITVLSIYTQILSTDHSQCVIKLSALYL